MEFLFLVFWFGLSAVVGKWSLSRGQSFWLGFAPSIFLSPIIGFGIVAVYKDITRLTRENNAAPMPSKEYIPPPKEVKKETTLTMTVTDEYLIDEFSDNQDIEIEIPSERDPNKYYTVNIKQATCTCPNFIKEREGFNKNDQYRYCKHLVTAIFNSDAHKELSSLNKAILDKSEYYKNEYFAIFDFPYKFVINFAGDDNWINVYAKDRTGNYRRFAFSFSELRWARHKLPEKAQLLEKLITDLEDDYVFKAMELKN